MTQFKGFLIQARGRWNGKAIGHWQTKVPNTKTMDCFGFPNVTKQFN